MQTPDILPSRTTKTAAIGAILIAVLAAASAWIWGRSTAYTGGAPWFSLDARARSIWFADEGVVVVQIDGLKVQRWRVSAGSTPRVFDLDALTARSLRARQAAAPDETGAAADDKGLAYDKAQAYDKEQAYDRSYRQAAPAGPAVAIGFDGNIAAWTIGRDLFVSPTEAGLVPFIETIERDCVPQLGTEALVLACRDNSVELRDILSSPGRLRGLIKVDAPPTLVQDGGSVLILSGPDVFEVKNAAEPYTRVNVDVGKSVHAIARSSGHDVAVSSSDGRLVIATARGGSAEIKTPGVADAMAFLPSGDLLAGGAFRGIYLLRAGADPQIFLPDVVGVRALAVRDGRVAYATADTVRMVPIVATRSFDQLGKSQLGLAAICLISALGLVFWPQQARAAADRAAAAVAPGAPFTLPLPEPPEKLVAACMHGDCVLYAGAGLSAQAGYPTWQPFVERLLARGIELQRIDAGFAESLRVSLASGQVDPVADALVSAVGRDEALNVLKNVFGPEQKIPEAHRLLKRIPFYAALTTNFDTLLERTYPEVADRVFTPKDAERLVDVLAKRAFFIAKLYGQLSRPETVLLAPAEYAETVARSLAFSQFMEGLFVSRTLFFVGASLEGIETYLSGLTFRGQMTRPHYALVAVTDAGWRAKADLLSRRYGIEVLPYTASGAYEDVAKFLERVVNAVSATPGVPSGAPRAASQGLRHLKLVNIGPFPELELDLQSDWNVLLGDNGVGKSSILKAIAACICGKDIEPYANRLVRAGEPSGTIELTTAQNSYRLEIRARENAAAEVTVLPTRPLEVEGALALGFPALRAVSWDRPKGATAEGRQRPTVDDLIPIVKGDPDPRLDRLKQWIVNLDSRINYERSHGGDLRYERLLTHFFEIVDRVTPGMSIRFGRVNQDTRAVTVVTDDGEIPIELISQGSVSLMGWIGVLLQRLYEIHGDDDDPTKRYALVLIDEIDAHMHPEWQQSVVFDMSGIFPNVQFIATTHSPLVVGGLKGRQVIRFMRDASGHVVRLAVTDDMLVGRADQILTGKLFGMQTTLDQRTQGSMARYETLLGKQTRTAEEEIDFQRLNKELKFKIPIAQETAPERKAFALVEAIINDQIAGSVPDARKPLLDKVQSLIDEVSGTNPRMS